MIRMSYNTECMREQKDEVVNGTCMKKSVTKGMC